MRRGEGFWEPPCHAHEAAASPKGPCSLPSLLLTWPRLVGVSCSAPPWLHQAWRTAFTGLPHLYTYFLHTSTLHQDPGPAQCSLEFLEGRLCR